MANIYYSYANNRLGALRAVLSPEAGRCLLDTLSKRYAGLEFPTGNDSRRDFALLRLFEGEASKEYRPGFYLFDDDLGPVDAALKHLTSLGDDNHDAGPCGGKATPWRKPKLAGDCLTKMRLSK